MSNRQPLDDGPAPGDLQQVADELEAQLRQDPETLEVWRSVFRQLASEPFDVSGQAAE